MKGRILVVILFFWAVLAVMTPLLVQWSAAVKLASENDGVKVKEVTSPGMRRLLPRRGLVADELEEGLATAALPPAPTPEPGDEIRLGEGKLIKRNRYRRPSLAQGI